MRFLRLKKLVVAFADRMGWLNQVDAALIKQFLAWNGESNPAGVSP
jgi:hypothetical protein